MVRVLVAGRTAATGTAVRAFAAHEEERAGQRQQQGDERKVDPGEESSLFHVRCCRFTIVATPLSVQWQRSR